MRVSHISCSAVSGEWWISQQAQLSTIVAHPGAPTSHAVAEAEGYGRAD